MNKRMLMLLAIVVPLVVLTSWLSRQSERPAAQPEADTAQLPDYYLHDLETTVTGKDGQPTHRFTASSLYHYPASDTLELEQPDFTVTDERNSWHASASQGVVSENRSKILLRGEVKLTQRGPQRMEFATDWLQLDAERHYAETDAAVLLTGATSRLQGVGMQLYGDEQRLRLLSTVRGRYAND